jgi:hypothetical protein
MSRRTYNLTSSVAVELDVLDAVVVAAEAQSLSLWSFIAIQPVAGSPPAILMNAFLDRASPTLSDSLVAGVKRGLYPKR